MMLRTQTILAAIGLGAARIGLHDLPGADRMLRWSVPASWAWRKGQRVAIDVAQGQKGPEAVGLRLR
jgi:hypothetical protein